LFVLRLFVFMLFTIMSYVTLMALGPGSFLFRSYKVCAVVHWLPCAVASLVELALGYKKHSVQCQCEGQGLTGSVYYLMKTAKE